MKVYTGTTVPFTLVNPAYLYKLYLVGSLDLPTDLIVIYCGTLSYSSYTPGFAISIWGVVLPS
jgi:hypothetical protein